MNGFSFFGALGLSDTKVGAWIVALATLATSLCESGVFGHDALGSSHTLCAAIKAIGAGGFGVMVNGARNAMEPKT